MSTPVQGVSIIAPVERVRVLPKEPRKKLTSKWASLVVVAITVLWTIPTFGLAITSLRPKADAQNSGWWDIFLHPQHLTLNNYHDVLAGTGASGGSIAPYFVNSIAITIPATLIPLALGSMAAYALAWVKFRGSTFIFFAIFALQVVPLQLALVPLLQLFTNGVHIGHQSILPLVFTSTSHHGALTQVHKFTIIPYSGLGGFYKVWIAHTMFGLPLVIFLLHNFMSQLPGDLIEAAQMDGANQFTIFRRIILPLSTPALASVLIFQFLWVWNDLLVATVFTDGTADHSPITARLVQLTGSLGSAQELLTAGAFIALIVPLVVFFSLQRFFVRGLLAGSVKS